MKFLSVVAEEILIQIQIISTK